MARSRCFCEEKKTDGGIGGMEQDHRAAIEAALGVELGKDEEEEEEEQPPSKNHAVMYSATMPAEYLVEWTASFPHSAWLWYMNRTGRGDHVM